MSYSGKDVDDLYDILSLSPGAKGNNETQPGNFMPENTQYPHQYEPDNIYTNFAFNQGNNPGNSQAGTQAGSQANNIHAESAKPVNLSVSTTSKTPITNTTPSPSTELLSPTNFSSYSNNNTGSSYLYPRSPSAYSSHSLYSDASSNPASPYLDASSQISQSHNPPSTYSPPQNAQLGLQYLDTNASNMLNTFDTEIALGGSISSTNLVGLDQVPQFAVNDRQPPQQLPQFNFSVNNQPMSLDFNMGPYQESNDKGTNSQLTENNLINYNNSISEQNHPTISVNQAPQDIAAKTPSLFSNSSANSSIHNSPAKASGGELSQQNTGNSPNAQKYSGVNNLVPNSHLVYGSGSASSSQHDLVKKEGDGLLKVDEFRSMRRGRRRSHSERSRSRSRSKSNVSEDDYSGDEGDYDDEDDMDDNSDKPSTWRGVSSREKMLELASPSQPAKRTQKHPSVYSCHLCEKRFTRPYNLKSHLRTHTDERPFICNVCGKAFARQHDRKRHEELHTGEKKFQCKGFLKDGSPYGCGRKFARADALRRHFQTENGKACIRLLIEEEEMERQRNGGIGPPVTAASVSLGQENEENGYLNSLGSAQSIPQVAISPPD